MSFIGSRLLGSVLSQTENEKMIRPWWDTAEQFLIYSQIIIGLLISPTLIIGTPLDCTLCTKKAMCEDKDISVVSPGYSQAWVSQYCISSLSAFSMYFPYIVILVAAVLYGIETASDRMFNVDIHKKKFFYLLSESPEADSLVAQIEVRQFFKNSSAFYHSYLLRNVIEIVVTIILFSYTLIAGIPSTLLSKGDYCNVFGDWYLCHGVPYRTYLLVMWCCAIIYLLSTALSVYALLWIICRPLNRPLYNFMKAYEKEMRKYTGGDDARNFLGDMYQIYYEDKDLGLLLDLIALTSGLELSLRVMAVLDSDFKNAIAPNIQDVERLTIDENQGSITLEVAESYLTKRVLSKLVIIPLIYTVQITPEIDEDSVQVLLFEKPDRNFFPFRIFRYSDSDSESSASLTRSVVFLNAQNEISYTLTVSLVLNGKTLTSKKRTLPVQKAEDTEDL